jgi:hypothetical protein
MVLSFGFIGVLIATILINLADFDINLIAYNIVFIFVLFLCLAGTLIATNKHILDIRMGTNKDKAKLLTTQNIDRVQSEEEQATLEKPKTVVKRGTIDDRRKSRQTR